MVGVDKEEKALCRAANLNSREYFIRRSVEVVFVQMFFSRTQTSLSEYIYIYIHSRN